MIRLAAVLALLVGCEACMVTEGEVPIGGVELGANHDRSLGQVVVPVDGPVLVLSRLEIQCHSGPHPECVEIPICRECDPTVEQCDAWQGYCNLVEEPAP